MLNVAIKQAGQGLEVEADHALARLFGRTWSEPVTAELTTTRFRHSDTVLLTDDGIEILTYSLRDLASLIISV